MSSRPSVDPNDREKVQIVKDLPGALKAALIARAQAEESNMNDVAVSILARALHVRYKGGSGRRSSRVNISKATTITLQMPARLHFRIKETAVRERTTQRSLIIRLLGEELLKGKRRAA